MLRGPLEEGHCGQRCWHGGWMQAIHPKFPCLPGGASLPNSSETWDFVWGRKWEVAAAGFTPVDKGARDRPTLKTSRGTSLGQRCSLETGLENKRVRDKHRAPHPYLEPETSKNTFWQLSADLPGRRGREGEPPRGRTLDAHPQHSSEGLPTSPAQPRSPASQASW